MRGLRVREHEALVGTGVLDHEPLELIEGALVRMVPQLPEHAETLHLASLALSAQLAPGWRLGTQLPLVASDRSEPEPDPAGVPDHWVLDVDAGRLHAHHGPGPDGYAHVEVHGHGVVRTAGQPSPSLDVDAVLRR